jgi:energy-coupling factor transporter ATP-binding protein EcfA2
MAFFKNDNYKTKTIFPNRDAKRFFSYQISHKILWKAIIERLKLRRDAFILITGKTGNGKSTITGKINFRFAELEDNFILQNGEKMFIPERHFITDGDEFAYKMITEQGSSLWYDEAREGSNRQAWYDKVNKAIKQRKNTNRKLFNVYWFCMPLETEFDPKLAAHLTCWIWVKKRTNKGAICEVYIANNERKGGRGLDIDAIIKREEKWLRENPKRTIVNPTIHPEYCGRLLFSSFTKEEEKRYNELVKMKSGTGKLTDEELEKFGLQSEKTNEEIVEDVVKKIVKGEINNKIVAWESLKDLDITDEKKKKMLDFYLNLFDMGTFNKVFDEKKKKMSNIVEQLKKRG